LRCVCRFAVVGIDTEPIEPLSLAVVVAPVVAAAVVNVDVAVAFVSWHVEIARSVM
jgi:hypothetical protein